MRRPSIAACGLDKYSKLLSSLFEETDGLAICDPNGIPLWAHDASGGRFTTDAAASLIGRPSTASREIPLRAHRLPGDKTLYEFAVFAQNDSRLGSLMVVFATRADTDCVVLRDSLESVAACIRDEYKLNSELDSMALELTERYEELNLLYDTEDQVSYFREGQDALEQLVRNCADYLDVDLALLSLPDKGIELHHKNTGRQIQEQTFLQSDSAAKLCEWVKENRQSVVINTRSDPNGAALLGEVPYRVIACPVFEGDSVGGILTTVNHEHRPEFRNSDRNLLTVVAKKAAKIVQASYDPLTGLMRRNGFEYCLEKTLLKARRNETECCVLHLNVDRIQVINDTAGHETGDDVLKRIAHAIREQVRNTDVVARLGGDEFGVLARNCPPEQGLRIAEKLRKQVGKLRVQAGENQVSISVSIGLAPLSAETESTNTAIAAAEVATSAAKELGRNRVQVYAQGDHELIQRKEQMHWVGRIQRAVRENQFQLYSQIIQPLCEQAPRPHVEILIRMQDEDLRLLSPGAFIPAAERYHLMPTIDRWVITNTLKLLEENADQWRQTDGICAINLSGQSVSDDDFPEFVVDAISRSGVPFTSICFEITETAAIVNITKAKEFMHALKDQGCSFSLDDFGSGLSSFAYLKDLPVDYLKIDGGFVKEITVDPVSESMVKAINQVGHIMGLKTIAEFVEHDDIARVLRKLGVDYVQGYGIGMPIPFEEHLKEFSSTSLLAVQ